MRQGAFLMHIYRIVTTDNFFVERCLNLSDLCMLHKNKTKNGIVRRFDKKCDIKLSTYGILDF